MRWVAIFEDAPQMLQVRQDHEPSHFEYLRAHEGEIVIAGGLRGIPGGPFVGACGYSKYRPAREPSSLWNATATLSTACEFRAA